MDVAEARDRALPTVDDTSRSGGANTRKRIVAVLRSDQGSTTAEFAIALPVLVAIVMLLSATLSSQGKLLLLQDGAADAARLIARDDSVDRAAALVRDAVPGATISVDRKDDLVCVVASAPVVVLVPWQLTARACALAGGL